MNDLAGFDLNLLRVLDALLAEHNVTRAAERVGLSQSAMSHALSRLRRHLDDPLFVRSPRGMVPTDRARRMGGAVRAAMRAIEEALREGDAFDPLTAKRDFRLSAVDMFGLVLLPVLMAQLAVRAPGLNLAMGPQPGLPVQDLEEGVVDLAVGVYPEAPESLRRQALFQDEFVCVVRTGHPQIRDALTLETFVALPHALVAPQGRPGSVVDSALARLGLRRRVALVVPHFLVAPVVVARTDLVLTLPGRVARIFSEVLPIRVLPVPIELDRFTISQFWHERRHHDPAHAFLRAAMVQAARDE